MANQDSLKSNSTSLVSEDFFIREIKSEPIDFDGTEKNENFMFTECDSNLEMKCETEEDQVQDQVFDPSDAVENGTKTEIIEDLLQKEIKTFQNVFRYYDEQIIGKSIESILRNKNTTEKKNSGTDPNINLSENDNDSDDDDDYENDETNDNEEKVRQCRVISRTDEIKHIKKRRTLNINNPSIVRLNLKDTLEQISEIWIKVLKSFKEEIDKVQELQKDFIDWTIAELKEKLVKSAITYANQKTYAYKSTVKNVQTTSKTEDPTIKIDDFNLKQCKTSSSLSKRLATIQFDQIMVIPVGFPLATFNESNLREFVDLQNLSSKFGIRIDDAVELIDGKIKISLYKSIKLKASLLLLLAKIEGIKYKNIYKDNLGEICISLECEPKDFTSVKGSGFISNESSVNKEDSSKKQEQNAKNLPKPSTSQTISIIPTQNLQEKAAATTNIKIKEEPIDDTQIFTSDVKIKQEINEDQPMVSNLPLFLTEDLPGTSQQEDTFIITEIGDVKQERADDDFSYFQDLPGTSSSNQNEDDEDEFSYNTVNSFKSDLATRRSVSHTVVSGKSEKSKAQAALLAMQELMKIEADKKAERERSAAGLNQIEKPKTMNVPLNIGGIRVFTKVPLPSVGTSKKAKSVEEECKHQCPICFIKFKTDGQLMGHKRIHDTAKAKLNTADMTKNVYREVKMRIEQIGNRRSIHVLLPDYDYAFVVTNSTANKLYMKCFRQSCEVKAYSTNDGKFFVKVGEEHCHASDRETIIAKINEKKMNDLEKTEVINYQVQEAIAEKKRQKSLMEEKKNALIERIKRSQEAAGGKNIVQEGKRRKL